MSAVGGPEVVLFNRLTLDYGFEADEAQEAAYEIASHLKDCGFSIVRSEFLRGLLEYAREVTPKENGVIGYEITGEDIHGAEEERLRRANEKNGAGAVGV